MTAVRMLVLITVGGVDPQGLVTKVGLILNLIIIQRHLDEVLFNPFPVIS